MEPLEARWRDVRGRISRAAERSGRAPSSVSLVAISKTHDVPTLREAYDLGVRDFGENRVAEAMGKISALPPDVRWHLVGQLQTNKINKIPGKFVLVHSVDSPALGLAMSRRLSAAPQEILLEVNTSGEDAKSGVTPSEAVQSARELVSLPNLFLRGLMTVGPLTGNADIQRAAFRVLKGLFDLIRKDGFAGDRFDTLSMGMSSDFEIAIEEGSTLVRVGTALFGERPPIRIE